MEMLLLSVLGPALRCDWSLTSTEVAGITTVVSLGCCSELLAGAPCQTSEVAGACFALSLWPHGLLRPALLVRADYFWLPAWCSWASNIGGAASSFTCLSEYLPQQHRAKILLAYLVLPTLGWRYLVAFSSLPAVSVHADAGHLPESARFLLASGRAEEGLPSLTRSPGRTAGLRWRACLLWPPSARRGQLQGALPPVLPPHQLHPVLLWFGVAFSYYGIVLHWKSFASTRNCFSTAQSFYGGHNTGYGRFRVDNSCCQVRSWQSQDDYNQHADLLTPWRVRHHSGEHAHHRPWQAGHPRASTTCSLACSSAQTYLCVPKAATPAFLFLIRAHSAGIFNTIYIYTTELWLALRAAAHTKIGDSGRALAHSLELP
uniref:GPI mannosyltransferase 2 n=1 Tax=Macrostomum lignano TaxID=282301 RepID=A0A1I8FBD2_9PLAT